MEVETFEVTLDEIIEIRSLSLEPSLGVFFNFFYTLHTPC